ncbi:MAG TPA: chitobiase/beta-hexosaminidase C-terminal domain-containing protein, partial [Methylomirabilota bacterium]|nr:chitobiase/beta-hexosaminidase C-terminal domain-containing protein [Methylomirabilota bacterium]
MEFSRSLIKRVVCTVLAVPMLGFAFLSSAEADAAIIPAPSMAPKGGVFASEVLVTLSGAAQEIRYTTDGSEPGTNSLLYSTPFAVTHSLLLKARAFASPTNGSDAVSAVFTLLDTNVASFNSTLPLVVINTFGNAIPAPTNASLWMQVINAPSGQRATLTNAAEFSGRVKLKPRGFTSLRYPKRSYT